MQVKHPRCNALAWGITRHLLIRAQQPQCGPLKELGRPAHWVEHLRRATFKADISTPAPMRCTEARPASKAKKAAGGMCHEHSGYRRRCGTRGSMPQQDERTLRLRAMSCSMSL